MAGYPRNIISLEQALKSLIKYLNEDKIKEATNKTEIWFRKCSDPHEKDKNIDHLDSIKLDIASLKQGKGSPMLQAHKNQVEKVMMDLKKTKKIENTLIDITADMGDLMKIYKDATNPKSRAGEEIDDFEKEQIYDAIKRLEDQISELKIHISNKKK